MARVLHGDRDLLVAYDPTNSPVDRILAYENMGTAFVSPQPLAVLDIQELPSPVDWDGDGDEDLVFREAFTSNVWWLESGASGLPSLAMAFDIVDGVEFGSSAQIAFEDADADGDVDAWVLGIKVLRYLQNGTEYGSTVCAGNPNSTGAGAAIAASGTNSAMSNGLVLTSSDLPPPDRRPSSWSVV